MNKKEANAWDSARKVFESRLKFFRIENSIGEGMSDVICQNKNTKIFWIETKALDAWPVRPGTLPLRAAFEPGQIPFMRDWCGWGAEAFVLVRVKVSNNVYQWLLLDPKRELREMTRASLVESCFNDQPTLESVTQYLESLT